CAIVLISVLTFRPTLATAEPIVVTSVVTSGNITLASSPLLGNSTFSMSGEGFSLSGFFSEGGPQICTPCPAGTQGVGLHYGGDMGRATGTVGATTFP